MANAWYYLRNGKRIGPLTPDELCALADAGGLKPADRVWRLGLPNWIAAANVNGLFDGPRAGKAAPANRPQATQPPKPVQPAQVPKPPQPARPPAPKPVPTVAPATDAPAELPQPARPAAQGLREAFLAQVAPAGRIPRHALVLGAIALLTAIVVVSGALTSGPSSGGKDDRRLAYVPVRVLVERVRKVTGDSRGQVEDQVATHGYTVHLVASSQEIPVSDWLSTVGEPADRFPTGSIGDAWTYYCSDGVVATVNVIVSPEGSLTVCNPGVYVSRQRLKWGNGSPTALGN